MRLTEFMMELLSKWKKLLVENIGCLFRQLVTGFPIVPEDWSPSNMQAGLEVNPRVFPVRSSILETTGDKYQCWFQKADQSVQVFWG